MNKKALIFIGLAVIALGSGLFLIINNKQEGEQKKEEPKEVINKEIVIDTTITDNKIDSSYYEFFVNEGYEEATIKDDDPTIGMQYTFAYPKEGKRSFLSDYNAIYESGESLTSIQIINKKSISEYIKDLKDITKEDETKSYSEKMNAFTIDTYEASYLKVQTLIKKDNKQHFEDKFYLFIQLEDKKFIVIAYEFNNEKCEDKVLEEYVKAIKITKTKGNYLSSEKDNETIRGTIKQNKLFNYVNGYNVEYTIKNVNYIEKEKYNDVSYNSFELSTEKRTLSYELIVEDNDDIVSSVSDQILIPYTSDEYKNYTKNEEQKYSYDSKEYIRIEYTYEKDTKHYANLFIYKIDNQAAISIIIDSTSEIDENAIKEVLNLNIGNY